MPLDVSKYLSLLLYIIAAAQMRGTGMFVDKKQLGLLLGLLACVLRCGLESADHSLKFAKLPNISFLLCGIPYML